MTVSEKLIAEINTNVFYEEFTFSKNEFFPSPREKMELADSVVLLDDILLIIQVKERNASGSEGTSNEAWFKNVVLNKAVKQVKASLRFFNSHEEIWIENGKGAKVNVSGLEQKKVHKLVVFHCDISTLPESQSWLKFYISSEAGHIHLFNLEDYTWVCKYLLTPAELEEYLVFREKLYNQHKDELNRLPEQYVLGHFLSSVDTSYLDLKFIETFSQFRSEEEKFDISSFIKKFSQHLEESNKNTQSYYVIIKELAKLKRYELAAFKERFIKIVDHVQKDEFSLPDRFVNDRTSCGFVFISLRETDKDFWENALVNFTEIYKYKRRLTRCLGLLCYKDGQYFNLKWAYIDEPWTYDSVLNKAVEENDELYPPSEILEVKRYEIKRD